MNDALKMQISAFVDGELPENESELLLRRLSQDQSLRHQAAEYLQIGRLIRREREVPGMGDLRTRIAAALGEQPVEFPARAEQPKSRLLKPAAGFAVAASVAVVALVGLRQVDVPGTGELPNQSAANVEAPAGQAAGYTEPLPAEALTGRPGEMLTQYYLSHGATSADLGANGILTRLVALELREEELVGTDANPAEANDPTGTPDDDAEGSADDSTRADNP
ncbi:MAG TPA: sigma-E factor negative regulatory protein [Woeseiaceae bacterium]|nr:sigma-E factor negative regulatory protein [Woeseiaceae bacterium]